MSKTLSGKVALVTGGSRGIGAAIAKRLAYDGADVAITYVSSPEKAKTVVDEIQHLGRRGLAIQADSGDGDAVVGAVNQTVETFGRIDLLVNNAGIFAAGGTIDQVTAADVDRMLAVNVRAVVLASGAAAKHMKSGASIIHIGSCLAERVTDPGISIYAMTKAALIGLTKGMARDLGPRGITVNVVHPGPIDTDMNPATGPQADAEIKHLALGHFGTGDDIAATVAHLAGESGRYITGASISVDGGFGA